MGTKDKAKQILKIIILFSWYHSSNQRHHHMFPFFSNKLVQTTHETNIKLQNIFSPYMHTYIFQKSRTKGQKFQCSLSFSLHHTFSTIQILQHFFITYMCKLFTLFILTSSHPVTQFHSPNFITNSHLFFTNFSHTYHAHTLES